MNFNISESIDKILPLFCYILVLDITMKKLKNQTLEIKKTSNNNNNNNSNNNNNNSSNNSNNNNNNSSNNNNNSNNNSNDDDDTKYKDKIFKLKKRISKNY